MQPTESKKGLSLPILDMATDAAPASTDRDPMNLLVESTRQTNSSESTLPPCCQAHAGDGKSSQAVAKIRTQSPYFCPMCPGQESEFPGECAICGMALESNPLASVRAVRYRCEKHPERLFMEAGRCPSCQSPLSEILMTPDQLEVIDMAKLYRRTRTACVLAAIVMLLSMLPMVGVPLDRWLGTLINGLLQASLTAWILLVVARPFWGAGWKGIRTGVPNMFSLIGIGTFAAYGLSLWELGSSVISSWRVAAAHLAEHGSHPWYFESAAGIVALVLVGQYIEGKARRKTGDAIRKLMSLAPNIAHRVVGDQFDDVATEQLTIGDRILVREGERVPIDGTVVEGQGWLDASSVSGETEPQVITKGRDIVGGILLVEGHAIIEVTKRPGQGMLDHVVRLVAHAQRSRIPIQDRVDAIAKWFTPAVVAIAFLAGVLWIVLGPQPMWPHAVRAFASVLIIACPCALGLAVPMSCVVGIGRAAQLGILTKDASSFDKFLSITDLVFDKTGTLTEGKPQVLESWMASSEDAATIWAAVAAIEHRSQHPLAQSLRDFAQTQTSNPLSEVVAFSSIPGKGVQGTVRTTDARFEISYSIGHEDWLMERGVDLTAWKNRLHDPLRSGSWILIACQDRVVAAVRVGDRPKSNAIAAVQFWRAIGVNLHIVSGDDVRNVEQIGWELGITQIAGRIEPSGKFRYVSELRKAGRIVAFAGDGINDAAALAAADVGVAMTTGADIAMDAADIALLQGDLEGLARARWVAEQLRKNIRQNLFLAFFYNSASIPIAAGALYPWLGILLNPMLAAAAMAVSCLAVVANAARLRTIAFKPPSSSQPSGR